MTKKLPLRPPRRYLRMDTIVLMNRAAIVIFAQDASIMSRLAISGQTRMPCAQGQGATNSYEDT